MDKDVEDIVLCNDIVWNWMDKMEIVYLLLMCGGRSEFNFV